MQTQKPFISLWLAGAFMFWELVGIIPALADTMVTLEQPVHFTNAEGSDVVLTEGSYTLTAAEEWLRATPSEGQSVDSVLLEAQTATHEESLSEPLAVSAQGESPDAYHLALLLPGGKRLEAIGSYSGIRSRARISLLTIQRLKALAARSQSTGSNEFSTPLFGGGGGNRSYDLDCGNGSVLVGAIYKAGLWLDALGIICQQVNSRTGVLESEFTRGPVGGSGGQGRIARCESGRVAQGIKAFSGQFINKFHMRCSEWDSSRKAPVPGQFCNPGSVSCLAFGGSGGAPSDLFLCPSDRVGKAIRGKHGIYIDSASFVCDDWDK